MHQIERYKLARRCRQMFVTFNMYERAVIESAHADIRLVRMMHLSYKRFSNMLNILCKH